jgi:hypothetical protein
VNELSTHTSGNALTQNKLPVLFTFRHEKRNDEEENGRKEERKPEVPEIEHATGEYAG